MRHRSRWSSWSEWSACSSGWQLRTRYCNEVYLSSSNAPSDERGTEEVGGDEKEVRTWQEAVLGRSSEVKQQNEEAVLGCPGAAEEHRTCQVQFPDSPLSLQKSPIPPFSSLWPNQRLKVAPNLQSSAGRTIWTGWSDWSTCMSSGCGRSGIRMRRRRCTGPSVVECHGLGFEVAQYGAMG
ncbi:unnamed protein product [Protopolystoma xenopodis]|uniref:SRCR domain-containing protein n=1 Tax=Protopolystoma xenopodis TaxID=117903 RepID=A0A448XFV6_9PLAT|nr:unnamed protein product [Protopolystoma xenopodis]